MVRLTDHLDMTIVVDWAVKPQNKQTKPSILLISQVIQEAEDTVEETVFLFGDEYDTIFHFTFFFSGHTRIRGHG